MAHLLGAYHRRGAARTSAALVVRGSLAPYFVFGTLIAGLAIPGLILMLHLSRGLGEGSLALAGALLLAGNFLSKYAVIKAGQFAPLVAPKRFG
jgi:formate-dependent nitrite reductase membrane component NrfD